jgi:hypothetical protein
MDDLCSLSRICRAFQFEAERLLYGGVELNSLADIIVWCKRIITCPRFAAHILRFDLGSNGRRFPGDERVIFRQRFLTMLSRALKLMTRLRVLCLPDLFGREVSCGRIFEGCTFKLQTFYSYFKCDDSLVAFLEKQDEIKAFGDLSKIDPSNEARTLPCSVLSNLSILSASEDTCHLVPGRPITHLDITSTIPLSLWPAIALSSGPIRVLHVVPSDDFARVMLDIPCLFPELEVLQGVDVFSAEVCRHRFYAILHLRLSHNIIFSCRRRPHASLWYPPVGISGDSVFTLTGRTHWMKNAPLFKPCMIQARLSEQSTFVETAEDLWEAKWKFVVGSGLAQKADWIGAISRRG